MKVYKNILIAAGGTGGHVIPGYSLANYLLKKNFKVNIVTDNRGLKFLKNFPSSKLKIISSATIFTNKPLKIILSIFVIFFAFLKSLIILINNRPSVIIGMGGYASFPICIAGKFLKIPFVLYENNLFLGKTNKYLLPFSDKIFSSYSDLEGVKKKYKSKIFVCGNIVREELLAYRHKKEKNEILKILVLGGSQAAKIFGEKLPQIFKECVEKNIKIEVYQQCTVDQNLLLKNFYKKNNITCEIFNFTENILEYYKKINLVITRSGSSVLAELLNCKIPFVSVPLPTSADNHQLKNAKYLADKGYNFLIEEKELDEKLFPLIKLICTDKSVLDRLIEKQKNHSDKKVYENINSELEKIIYGKY